MQFTHFSRDNNQLEGLDILHLCPYDKLVKHLQSHNGGRDSLYYIKYIMDHMEEGKSDAIAWVRVEAEKEKKLVEEEKSQLNEKLNGTKKELEDAKGEMRKYRKKSDTSKEKIAKLEAELKEVKAKFEAELKETKGSLENQQAGHDKLIEAKAKLEIKLDIQKTDNEELKVGSEHKFKTLLIFQLNTKKWQTQTPLHTA